MALYIGNDKVTPEQYEKKVGINREVTDGTYRMPSSSFTFSLPRNASNLGEYSLTRAFRYCSSLTSVDLSNLTTINGNYALCFAFSRCNSLTSVDFSNLATISGDEALSYTFADSIHLTSVSFPLLNSITGNRALMGCFRSIDMNSSLTTLSFPALTSTSFGSYTNQFSYMLDGVTGCTVHFPSNLQSVIGSWSDVTAGFGSAGTTVLFDLPATT